MSIDFREKSRKKRKSECSLCGKAHKPEFFVASSRKSQRKLMKNREKSKCSLGGLAHKPQFYWNYSSRPPPRVLLGPHHPVSPWPPLFNPFFIFVYYSFQNHTIHIYIIIQKLSRRHHFTTTWRSIYIQAITTLF